MGGATRPNSGNQATDMAHIMANSKAQGVYRGWRELPPAPQRALGTRRPSSVSPRMQPRLYPLLLAEDN